MYFISYILIAATIPLFVKARWGVVLLFLIEVAIWIMYQLLLKKGLYPVNYWNLILFICLIISVWSANYILIYKLKYKELLTFIIDGKITNNSKSLTSNSEFEQKEENIKKWIFVFLIVFAITMEIYLYTK